MLEARIAVQRQAVDVPAVDVVLPGLHHLFGPVFVTVAGADGDAQHVLVALLRRVEVLGVGGEFLELLDVMLDRHRAAAAVAFVADAEIGDLERGRVAVGGAFLRQGCRFVGGHVFEPLGRLLRRAGADIARDVGFGTDLVDEVHEFVGAEGVGLQHAAPVGIERGRALFGGADALAPVVFIGEAAAGPADIRDLDGFQGADDVVADAAGVGDRGIGADPDAFVNAVAEVLGELAEDVAVDRGARLCGVDRDGDGRHFVLGQGGSSEGQHGCGGEGEE